MYQRQFCIAACGVLWLLAAGVSHGETLLGRQIVRAQRKGQSIGYVQNEILVSLNPWYGQDDLLSQIAQFNVKITRNTDRFGILDTGILVQGGQLSHPDLNNPGDDPWSAAATLTIERYYSAGDANRDVSVDIDDAVYLIAYIFSD